MRRIPLCVFSVGVLCCVLVLSLGCAEDDASCGEVGDFRCEGLLSIQICTADGAWETVRVCRPLAEQCTTAALACSGFTNIACCVPN